MNFIMDVDIENINDSMELATGTEIACLKIGDYFAEIKVCGEVRVTYKEQEYTDPMAFPPELTQMFHNGTAWTDPGVTVSMNNWFELFHGIDNEISSSSEVISLQGETTESIKKLLEGVVNDYICEYEDATVFGDDIDRFDAACEFGAKFSYEMINAMDQNDISFQWTGFEKRDDGTMELEIEFWSKLGEDIIFTIYLKDHSVKAFVDGFEEYAKDFDPDDHAEMNIELRGTHGVPDSIRDLLDDAEDIKKTLMMMAKAMREQYDKEYTPEKYEKEEQTATHTGSGYTMIVEHNGSSFEMELSLDELREAYMAYQEMCDKEDVKNIIETREDCLNEEYDLDNNPLSDEDIARMAKEYRYSLDNNDECWYPFCQNVVEEYLTERKERIEKETEREES